MMNEPFDAGVHRLSRRELLRGAAGLGLVAATMPLLSACGSGGEGDSDSAGEVDADAPLETTSINLFSVPPFSCFAAQYVAESFLREEGFTDITYKQHSPLTVIDKFAAGEIDFGIVYPTVLAPHIEAGKPFVLLGGIHAGCWKVFGGAGTRSMRDLKGKKVSFVGAQFTDGIFMVMTLTGVGLELGKDVELVNNPPTENARLLSSGEVDAVIAVPPLSTDLEAKGIGTVILNSATDPPWSNYFCCMAVTHRTWLERHPVAAKRALRAVLKGADVVAKDPIGTARLLVDRGYTNNFDYACETLKEIPYDIWRDFDSADSVRFYALRLKEAGIIKSTPEQILEWGTDFRYLQQLKRELKEA